MKLSYKDLAQSPDPLFRLTGLSKSEFDQIIKEIEGNSYGCNYVKRKSFSYRNRSHYLRTIHDKVLLHIVRVRACLTNKFILHLFGIKPSTTSRISSKISKELRDIGIVIDCDILDSEEALRLFFMSVKPKRNFTRREPINLILH